jgi:hypothetical protein
MFNPSGPTVATARTGGSRPSASWWYRGIVSDTHLEPDFLDEAPAFFRTVVACVTLVAVFGVASILYLAG